jgi:hypothetical protein
MLSDSTGIGRTRVRWDGLSDLQVPRPTPALAAAVTARLDAVADARRKAEAELAEAQSKIAADLYLVTDEADAVIAAFKPPR